MIPPTLVWSDTQQRIAHYAHAFRNINRVVAAYVEDLRERYNIAKRDSAHCSCPLRLASQSTSPGFAE